MSTMRWNNEAFVKWREKAITNLEQLVPGTKYYENDGGSFVFVELLTYAEMVRRRSDRSLDGEDNLEIAWMAVEKTNFGGEIFEAYESLKDRNIGDSYNPWLIFDNPSDADQCFKELEITWEEDPWDFDEYDFDGYHDDYQ